ncbi:MAG TPA: alkaline phosphatase family protein, partial [Planctomycetota bacterium]|nr:alkaline phosphatase family protein [Planctomycetota bacterium]
AVFHLVECGAGGLRLFVPPINIDPLQPPPQMPISAPPGFAAELQAEIGHPYETLGWACITNPLKDYEDSRLDEQSFMDDMVSTEALREELLLAGLDRAQDWDVYFQVFSTPDRVGHMLFRETDPAHPLYDEALANSQVTAWGQSFPLKDALLQCYRNADRIVGEVLDRLARGDFGADCLLLVVSDHGFSSFRRQVNLNNALYDLGFLKFKGGEDLEAVMRRSWRERDLLGRVDWKTTKAYSLGLGEVFVNLAGREPQGIVPPEQYDATVAELQTALLGLRDPKDGARVVTSVSRRDELYDGPWWKEGTAARKVRGVPVEVRHDGFADLFLGYEPGYRVSWGNTMGGLDDAAITDNDNHWSGDHVSVDPRHVPGILFSNRPLERPAEAHLDDVAPTMLVRYGLDPAPPHTEMDGSPLPFQNLTR